jgi:uncharacterized membrane protein YidH (DUF202 family)
MKSEQDYIQDIAEIRSMMERSSKFMSLSGLAGIMAGIYALAGAWFAHRYLAFQPDAIYTRDGFVRELINVIILGITILTLAVGTAIILSQRKAKQKGVNVWNSTSRRMIISMAVPLFSGGFLILMLLVKGLIGLVAPLTLLFYGLALYNASRFTFEDVKYLGFTQILLGLLSCWFIGYGLLFWAIGFGVVHILYGIYMHFRYER